MAHKLLSAASGKSGLSILIYHRVFDQPDPFLPDVPDITQFSWQMELLHHYYNVVSLEKAINLLQSGQLPARTACVTFDDGYADNFLHALPILQQWNIPATFFVASGFLNGGMMWNDRVLETIRHYRDNQLDLSAVGLGSYSLETNEQRKKTAADLLPAIKYLPPSQRNEVVQHLKQLVNHQLPVNLMMNTTQLKQLHSSGMEIGGHTLTHPILSSLTNEQAEQEIRSGRDQLSKLLDGARIRYFAYPNGKPGQDYTNEHAEIVKNLGFEAAVSTSWSTATSASDLFQLPRFTPWDADPLKFAIRLMKNTVLPYE
ncbi:MAG TPA: polysaccharide deacetylase family protein [Crenotrichaceae bacterium]|nr:polysaccharide deacetylase family protein [Crenotrichaceae bacterium]